MIKNRVRGKWYILVLALIALVACSDSKEIEETTLELSETKVVLPKTMEEALHIDIKTNAKTWTAFAESSWIQVYKDGAQLVLKATPNDGVVTRNGVVKVLADSKVKSIQVEQTATEVMLTPVTEEAELDQWGGDISIYVDTNTKDWEASSDEEWVKLSPHPIRNTLIVSVSENTSEDARQAQISFSYNNQIISTCVIKQTGKLTFLMPAPTFLLKVGEVRSFESKRRSDIIKIPDGFVNTTIWGFKTQSELFPKIEYEFIGERYISAKVFAQDAQTIPDNMDGLKAFLAANGFVEDSGEGYYINEALEMSARINVKSKVVEYVFSPHQPEPYKTFDTLPLGPRSFSIGDEEIIEEYEKEMGGTFNKDRSRKNYLFYNASAPWLHRAYEIQKSQGQIVQSIPNINLAVFMVGEYSYLTKEFKELATREGFQYVEYVHTYKMHMLRNPEKRISLSVRPGKSIVDDQNPVLFVNVVKHKQ